EYFRRAAIHRLLPLRDQAAQHGRGALRAVVGGQRTRCQLTGFDPQFVAALAAGDDQVAATARQVDLRPQALRAGPRGGGDAFAARGHRDLRTTDVGEVYQVGAGALRAHQDRDLQLVQVDR